MWPSEWDHVCNQWTGIFSQEHCTPSDLWTQILEVQVTASIQVETAEYGFIVQRFASYKKCISKYETR